MTMTTDTTPDSLTGAASDDEKAAAFGTEPTGLQLLLDALHATAIAGDAKAAWMLRLLRQSLH